MEIPERIPVVQCPPFVTFVGWGVICIACACGSFYGVSYMQAIAFMLAFRAFSITLAYLIVIMLAIFAVLAVYAASAFYLLRGRRWSYVVVFIITLPTVIGPIFLLLQRAEYFRYCEYRRKEE